MLKMVTLIRRRAGMTMAEFIEAYESDRVGHRLLGEKFLRPYASRYVRRFLHPVEVPGRQETDASPFDVLLEIWFPDRATYEAAMSSLAAPAVQAEIALDEARLFDRSSLVSFIVEEHESALG